MPLTTVSEVPFFSLNSSRDLKILKSCFSPKLAFNFVSTSAILPLVFCELQTDVSLTVSSSIGTSPFLPLGIAKLNTASLVSLLTDIDALADSALSIVVTVPILGVYVVPSMPLGP